MSDASYSTAEVARLLGVSIPTIQRWVDLGVLKAWKTIGGHRRLDAASVKTFIAENGLAEAAPAPAPVQAPSRQAASLSVLIVDDNPDDRDLLEAMIDAALPGSRVQCVANGFQALMAIGREVPQVLVSDLMMPHMNGLEMLRHLNGDGAGRPPVIVAVSSETPRDLAHLGALPHGVRFVQKPIEAARFNTTLREGLVEAGLAPARRKGR